MDQSHQFSRYLAGVAALKPAAVIRVSGGDAVAFLQGQFTQELRGRPSGAASYGLWLNQKGRIVGDSYVLQTSEEECWLISERVSAERLLQRLEPYVIADDVILENVTANWSLRHVFGEAAVRDLGVSATTSQARAAVPHAGGWAWEATVLTRPQVIALVPATAPLPDELIARDDLERARLAAGVPAVPDDAGLDDLPNEAGLEEAAISYTKGCYLGQEVMARLKSMGRVRRRLFRVFNAEGTVPAPRQALFQGSKQIGELRSVIGDGAGGWLGLAMLSLLHLNPAAPLALEATTVAEISVGPEARRP